ncbi:Papain cysteine protease family protein [Acanthocheilonema viteae]
MKAFFVLYLASFLVLIYTDPFNELDNDDTPGKIHSLYQQHYSNYKKYLKKFSKKHDPSVPEPIRLLKFVQNVKMIDEHNRRYTEGKETYKLALNEMSDWTGEEKERLRGYVLNRTGGVEANMSQILKQKAHKIIPDSFDYRSIIKLAPVKNQGNCGVCFIFSALGALEMYIALKNKQPAVRLSVQDIMDCSNMEKCSGRGGNAAKVFEWIAEHGVTTDQNYPYKGRDSISCPRSMGERIKAELIGGVYLPRDNEKIIRKVLVQYGPVVLTLHAKNNFVNYESAVGYGVENGMKYFIIRNSWGTTWGTNGYARIRAGVFMCGIGRESTIPVFAE